MDSSLPLPNPSGLSTLSVTLPTHPPPGRLRVFLGVWWRSLVVSIVGGAVIGALVALPFLVFTDDANVALASLFGAWFGIWLGLVAGAIVAGLSAALLVPYRTAAHCVKVVRVTACVPVGLFVGWLLLGIPPVAVGAVVLGVGGAILAGPWLIGWYIRRCDVPAQR